MARITEAAILSIDPGVFGAGAQLIFRNDSLFFDGVWDMPRNNYLTVTSNGSPDALDIDGLQQKVLDFLRAHEQISFCRVVVERQYSVSGNASKTTFKQAYDFGSTETAINLLLKDFPNCELISVPARVWKRHFGLKGGDKNASRDLATHLFGEETCRQCWPMKKHEGRCEAVLIGTYYWCELGIPGERLKIIGLGNHESEKSI